MKHTKKILNSLLILTIFLYLGAGCVSPGGGGGILLNSYTGPFQVTNNTTTTKKGESSVYCMLALVCFGDAGIATAAQEGEISKVATVDYSYFSLLGPVFNSTTIIVTGE